MPNSVHGAAITLSLIACVIAFPISAKESLPPTAQVPDGYQRHLDNATAAAQGIASSIAYLCTVPEPNQKPIAEQYPDFDFRAPGEIGQAFDNLYFVGLRHNSAWAVTTSEGIILIDALNNAEDVKNTIIPAMRAQGLDPAQIKYLVISHAHGDHYGGARYILEQFRPQLVASDADWTLMEATPSTSSNPLFDPPPQRDLTVKDGEQLTLGETSISVYVTPGHTPGTLSLVIPVWDQGVPHTAAFLGGTAFNFPSLAANFRAAANSADRFKSIVMKAGADVLLSNHGRFDNTQANLLKLQKRKPGDGNPYVVGTETVSNFFTVAGECARAREAAAKE